MKKDKLLPLAALLGGAVGFVLRRVQWATGFETDTGLSIPGAPAAIAMAVFSLVVAVVLALLCRGPYRAFSGYDDAFFSAAPAMRFFPGGAALALVIAGAWRMQELLVVDWPEASLAAAEAAAAGHSSVSPMISGVLLPLLSVVMCVLSAISLLLIARNSACDMPMGQQSVWLILPAFGSCLWLILTYRACSDNPVLTAYAYLLLALLCVTLAMYQYATFSFTEKNHPAATLFFSLMGIYFSLVSLADGRGLTTSLLLLASVLFLTIQAFALMHNNAGSPRSFPSSPSERRDEDGNEDEATQI